jgi:hypothetical protein
MDPLIEVSTVGGKNMRETCARVLAAALMTGAIATVVGMSALFDTPREPVRPISAPPSSLQRSVRIQAAAVHRRPRVVRIETAHWISLPSRPVVVTRRLVTAQPRRQQPPRRRLASAKPRQLPATASTAPAQLAAVAPAPAEQPAAPEAPAAVTEERDDADDNHGNANGHDKAHKHGHNGHNE